MHLSDTIRIPLRAKTFYITSLLKQGKRMRKISMTTTICTYFDGSDCVVAACCDPCSGCGPSPVDKPAGVPTIVFESLAHDFGTAQPNTPLTHNFVFTNQGTAPLLIEKVKAG